MANMADFRVGRLCGEIGEKGLEVGGEVLMTTKEGSEGGFLNGEVVIVVDFCAGKAE